MSRKNVLLLLIILMALGLAACGSDSDDPDDPTGVLTVYGFQFAHFVRAQISPALQIPKWTVLVVLPLSGAILCLHTVTLLFEAIRSGRSLDG